MSKLLNNYRQQLKALEQLQAELQKMEESAEFRKEREFMDALRALQNEHSVSDITTLKLLGAIPAAPLPESVLVTKMFQSAGTPVWEYTNPYTGETVQASRANNKVVRAWTKQYSKETVTGWRTLVGVVE